MTQLLIETRLIRNSITMNRAFLQEVHEDKLHYRAIRGSLRALTANRRFLRVHLQRLVTLLEALRDQLAIHFSLEEAQGYFDDVVKGAPRLSGLANKLRSQHAELFSTLVGIADDAATAQAHGFAIPVVRQLVKRTHDFEKRLTEHEQGEYDLIVEAMERDIGGEG